MRQTRGKSCRQTGRMVKASSTNAAIILLMRDNVKYTKKRTVNHATGSAYDGYDFFNIFIIRRMAFNETKIYGCRIFLRKRY